MTTEPLPSVNATLRAAKAKIADPKHWIKGTFARKSKRSRGSVPAQSMEAGAWCAWGALSAVDGPFENEATAALALAITDGASRASYYIHYFNDDAKTRHAHVMAAYDKAIANTEPKQ